MSASANDQHLFVEDVVTALTSAADRRPGAGHVLEQQLKRAAKEFDQRTAEAFARALIDHLCETPDDVRSLEALLILGLAHPDVLAKHRVSLETEGRRLAVLLEHAGEVERARHLLETLTGSLPAIARAERHRAEAERFGPDQEQIEFHLRKADDAAAIGRLQAAIEHLQQVVQLDRERRDVQRMIRDLRFRQQERSRKARRFLRFSAVVIAVAGAGWVVVDREGRIAERYRAIAPATGGDLASLRLRLAAIDDLVGGHLPWTGLPRALLEQRALRREVNALEDTRAASERTERAERAARLQEAEDLRSRALVYAQQKRFPEALADLRRALDVAGAGWERRASVEAEIASIERWSTENGRADER